MTDEELAWMRSAFDERVMYIQDALDADLPTHTLQDVWDMIADPTKPVQFWPTPNGAVVTMLDRYPRMSLLRFWLAGGDLGELSKIEPRIAEWGRRNGCEYALIGGRDGWVRKLAGYRKVSSVMVRPLI